jgi:hypothetical protein
LARALIASIFLLALFLTVLMPTVVASTVVPLKANTINQLKNSEYAGYQVYSNKHAVSSVSGSWIVPSLNCSMTPDAVVDVAIGITGGEPQIAGTAAFCFGGLSYYYLYYEDYPNLYMYFPRNVNASDLMNATIKYHSPNVTISVHDQTEGWTFSTSNTISGLKTYYAVWLTGTFYQCNQGYSSLNTDSSCYEQPLADFGHIYYGYYYTDLSSDSATIAGVSKAIGSFGTNTILYSLQDLKMHNCASGCIDTAQASSLVSTGSFYVSWENP